MMIPQADRILTPAQYGAAAPDGRQWPINDWARDKYAVLRIYPTVQGEGLKAGTPMTIVRLQGCPVGCVFCDTPESWAPPGRPAAQSLGGRKGGSLGGFSGGSPGPPEGGKATPGQEGGGVEGSISPPGGISLPRPPSDDQARGGPQGGFGGRAPGGVSRGGETLGAPKYSWWRAEDVAQAVKGLPPRWALITGGEPCWHQLFALTHELWYLDIRTALETSGVYDITGRWDWVCISPKPAGLLPFKREQLARADELKWIVGKASDIPALERLLADGPIYAQLQVTVQPMSCSSKATAICLDALMKHPDWRLSLQVHKMMEIA